MGTRTEEAVTRDDQELTDNLRRINAFIGLTPLEEDSPLATCGFCASTQGAFELECRAPAQEGHAYLCTRIKGHPGAHVACGGSHRIDAHPIATWGHTPREDGSEGPTHER